MRFWPQALRRAAAGHAGCIDRRLCRCPTVATWTTIDGSRRKGSEPSGLPGGSYAESVPATVRFFARRIGRLKTRRFSFANSLEALQLDVDEVRMRPRT